MLYRQVRPQSLPFDGLKMDFKRHGHAPVAECRNAALLFV